MLEDAIYQQTMSTISIDQLSTYFVNYFLV